MTGAGVEKWRSTSGAGWGCREYAPLKRVVLVGKTLAWGQDFMLFRILPVSPRKPQKQAGLLKPYLVFRRRHFVPPGPENSGGSSADGTVVTVVQAALV